MSVSSPNNPRGHPKDAKSRKAPAENSKKFLREFFSPEYGGKPKRCNNKDVQCGLPGLARGTDWPTVDPSSAPSGGPSGDGGAGGGGGGVGASVAASKEKQTMSTRFRREMSFGGAGRVAAPPKELGSNPEELRKQFTQQEEMEPPVVVSADEVEVVDEPSRYSSGEGEEMSGGDEGGMAMAEGDSPDTAVEVGEEEVAADEAADSEEANEGADESRVEEGSMTFRSGNDDPSEVHELTPEEAAEVEVVSDEAPDMGMEPDKESPCVCPCGPSGGENIPVVEETDVEFLGGDDEDEEEGGPSGRGKEEAYAYACTAGEAESPSKGPSGDPSKTVEEEDKHAKAVAAELVEVLTPIEALGEVDIADVELDLFNEDSENPHYTVMVKGEPVAKIALSDQALPPEHSDMFLQDEYPQTVLEGIENFGIQDTLQSVHARYYASKAYEGAVAAKMKEAAMADLAAESRRHIAKVKDDLSNVAALVIEGSLKNYIVTNPLRDALVQQMRRAGVDADAAVDLVEEAFREAGATYFNTILAKAEEWMGAPKEAMEHHVKEITGMSYRHPGYALASEEDDIPEAIEPEEVPQMTTASVPRNVPLRTAGAPAPQARTAEASQNLSGNWQADKAAWKSRLNLFGRVASVALANAGKLDKSGK